MKYIPIKYIPIKYIPIEYIPIKYTFLWNILPIKNILYRKYTSYKVYFL